MIDSIGFKLRSISILLLISFNPITKANNEKTVKVATNSGEVIGRIETPIDDKVLAVFRGVPYAQPPVGRLRFRPPVPHQAWNEPINAFQFQSSCIQNTTHFDVAKYLVNKQLSEDCLYLNIWSPIDSKEALKPVLVWIHGGGLLVGGASEEYYQGDVLAAKGDVVVVSFNYRLSTLGFFYAGTDDAPGNVGFLDQAMALQWVKDNIEHFGGDPNRVTIIGESAGGWSTSLHVISPVSRNLFRNAIAISGAYLFKFKDHTPEDQKQTWLKGAARVGCSDEENPNRFTDRVMECLRAADPLQLVYITDMLEFMPGSIKYMDIVVVDGVFLPKQPIDMLRSGDYKQDVNLLISTVGNEGGFLLSQYYDTIKYNALNPKQLTRKEAFDELWDISERFNSEVTINGEDVAQLYFTGLPDNDNHELYLHAIAKALGDFYLGCPAILFGKEVFKNSGFKSSVYQVHFNAKLQYNEICSKWMGVCHANDNNFIFGMPFFSPEYFNDREREISAQMIRYLSHFAKNDAPDSQDGAEWERFYELNGNIIGPYYEITNVPKNVTNFGLGLKITECEYLWRKYII